MVTENFRGAMLMVASMVLFAFEDMFIKLLAAELPFSEVLTLIGLLGALCFAAGLKLQGGRLLTRDQLLEAARGSEADVFDRAMDVQISRLRKKLDDGSGRELIATIRGEGYRFDARVRRADRAGARA